VKDFKIDATNQTPQVHISYERGHILIRGRSFSEDSPKFFATVFTEADKYFAATKKNTIIELCFEYFNSSSYKLIINLLLQAKKAISEDNTITVKWCYEEDDDDILNLGKETERLTQLKFEYYPIAE
jgi:hypothetical protein